MVEFHNHLNSVNPNIQLIKEVEEESRLYELHNHQGVWRDTSVFIKETSHKNRLISTTTPIIQSSTRDQMWIHSVIGLDKYHRQKQNDPERGKYSLWLIKNCKSCGDPSRDVSDNSHPSFVSTPQSPQAV